jgi:hypothetical protein
MTIKYHILILLIITKISICFIFVSGCKEDTDRNLEIHNLPVLNTEEISDITSTSAISCGMITDNGGAEVTERGFYWICSLDGGSEKILTGNKIVEGKGTGNFNSHLTDLMPYNKYYVRAYATNRFGTAYGKTMVFTTLPGDPIFTAAVKDIAYFTATVTVNIIYKGTFKNSEIGVCYASTPNPTINDIKIVVDDTETEQFKINLTELKSAAQYYIRSYAINKTGVVYGNECDFQTFMTPAVGSRYLESDSTSYTEMFSVFDTGGLAYSELGIYYSTNLIPTFTDTKVVIDNSGKEGEYKVKISELSPNTFYYNRLYAVTHLGTFFIQNSVSIFYLR